MEYDKRIKVCYILPQFSSNTATHFYAKREMLDMLSSRVDFLSVDMQRLAASVFAILRARSRGCKHFYVHYSLKGALVAHVVTALSGGRVYYWNCGMPWLYQRSWLEERLLRWVLRHSLFVTGTRGLARMYAHEYGTSENDTRILPNWVRTDRFAGIDKITARSELRVAPRTRMVLFAHHLSRRKGAQYLPDIFRLYKSDPSVLFVIAGSGPEEGDLIKTVQALDMESSVRFVGDVPNRAIPQYFAAADVVIVPSEEQGFSNTLLEAMAAGVPFVSFDVGGTREMTSPAAQEYIAKAGDTAGFCARLQRLLADSEMRARVVEANRQWVEQYDIRRVAPQFANLFSISL